MSQTPTTAKAPPPENGFLNILFNIIIPVLILNKLSKFLSPVLALALALAFPIGYGAYDLIKRKKTNAMSILGLLNVALTGGLAIAGLTGIWFAIKEAAFPALVGLFVLGSAFSKKPFIETLFLNPSVMKVDLLEAQLKERGLQGEFHEHMRKATMWLSLSFVFSAICNFVLASKIFTEIDGTLSEDAKSTVLNEQIAQMTTWSMAIIMIPSILFLLGIFWYLMKGIKQYAGLTTEDLLQEK